MRQCRRCKITNSIGAYSELRLLGLWTRSIWNWKPGKSTFTSYHDMVAWPSPECGAACERFGAALLPDASPITVLVTAIALSSIAVCAEEKHCTTPITGANPLSEY